MPMLVDELMKVKKALLRLAKETRDTATGSSRVEMYEAIAAGLDDQAVRLSHIAGDLPFDVALKTMEVGGEQPRETQQKA